MPYVGELSLPKELLPMASSELDFSACDELVEDFLETADSIENFVQWFSLHGRAAQAMKPLLSVHSGDSLKEFDEGGLSPAAYDFWRMSEELRIEIPIQRSMLLFRLCAEFERVILALTKEFAIAWCDGLGEGCKVPKVLREYLEGKLKTVMANPNRYRLSLERVSEYLSSQIEISSKKGLPPKGQRTKVYLLFDLLMVTDSNLRFDLLSSCLKPFCKQWLTLVVQQNPVKEFFGVVEDQACKERLRENLNSLMDVRNLLAHPTTGSETFPDGKQIVEFKEFLETLVPAINGSVKLTIKENVRKECQ